MKRALPLTLALLSGIVLTTQRPLLAHEGHDDATTSPAPGNAAMMQKHAERMKEMNDTLGLTAEQKTKIEALQKEQMSVMPGIGQKGRELRQRLGEQVKNNAPDAELQATLSDLEVNRKTMTDQIEKFRQQREAILTPKQRAQSLLMMDGMRHDAKMQRKEMKGKK